MVTTTRSTGGVSSNLPLVSLSKQSRFLWLLLGIALIKTPKTYRKLYCLMNVVKISFFQDLFSFLRVSHIYTN